MRFTLFEALILMVPIAFLAVLATEFFNTKSIEWKKFTLDDFRQTQKENTPAIILCRPHMFWDPAWGKIDEERLLDNTSTPLAAYRHDYRYWTSSKPFDQRTPEDKWVLDNGGYKEPLLILVSGGGSLRAIKKLGFDSSSDTQEIVEFLELSRWRRAKAPFYLFAISLIACITLIVYRRNTMSIGG